MSAKPDDYLAELLSTLVDIARTGARSHISREFYRCANSSAGSSGDPIGFLTPIHQSSPTAPTTPATGTSVSVLPTEVRWWTAQDSDQRYLAEMEDQLRQWEDDER